MQEHNLIAEMPYQTVVATYPSKVHQQEGHQSEAQMESLLIKQLTDQGYEYLSIHTERELIDNLRYQIEHLNGVQFSATEWQRFFREHIGNPQMGIVEKTQTIQNDYRKTFIFDDGSIHNIDLIDKEHIHRNCLQVLNQYEVESKKTLPSYAEDKGSSTQAYAVKEGSVAQPDARGSIKTQQVYEGESIGVLRKTRFDVTILVNGLPLVHIELKKRGVAIREAFNQIKRYHRDSFWAGSGLYDFVQLFIISNGTHTKYYSNTTRRKHTDKENNHSGQRGKQTSNSFEFTSYWAAADNQHITDIEDFTATFLSKNTLLNILCKYCILTIDNDLLVMRPYQIAATEAIMQRILISTNRREWGCTKGGGYIWHTTGSGKTLTSFKTARQCCDLPDIDKVLFVVDRKDLDHQTMREYDRFEKGAANSTKDTTALKKQLEKPNGKIVITTIQKLSVFIKKNPDHAIYGKHVVMIFDECHRSQFGEMHHAIAKHFKRYHLFGFTGTPIFPINSPGGKYVNLLTTEQTFGDRLHCYTIDSAIRDENVLPFRIDYLQTMFPREEMQDEQVEAIAEKNALLSPARIEKVVAYTLAHYDMKTKRNAHYTLKDKRVQGFNSLFACESIEAARLYYAEFQRQQARLTPDQRLKIALIYSYAPNGEDPADQGYLGEENSEDTSALSLADRDFLEVAIGDYNKMFQCTYSTDGDRFQDYYKNVSERLKNRELDMLIVVNMFLTGFDATTLNTLWVDKNLRQHGLLQAFSRTNRILNSIKTFGNIVCFRELSKATDEAIALFGDPNAGGVVVLRPYKDYINGYDDEQGKHHAGYQELQIALEQMSPLENGLETEEDDKAFIRLFGSILRVNNILSCFEQFTPDTFFSEGRWANYQSLYLDLKEKYRPDRDVHATDVNDDLVFEIELIKQVEVNIGYILHLVEQMHHDHTQDKEVALTRIRQLISAAPDLRDKRELIEEFIDKYTPENDIDDSWNTYICRAQRKELEQIIREEDLESKKTYQFVANAFKDGRVKEEGTAIVEILPKKSLSFFGNSNRAETKARVLEKIRGFFQRFFDISGGLFTQEEQEDE